MTGEHIALYYEDDEALWQKCATLIRDRARENSAWLYVADEHSPDCVCDVLSKRLGESETDATSEVKSVSISVLLENVIGSSLLRLRDSRVLIAPIVTALRERIQSLMDAGAAHVFLLIEMTWAIRTPSGAVSLAEYEAAIQLLQEKFPLTVCCLYNKAVLLDSQLLVGLYAHSHIHTANGLCANPYVLPPALLTQPNPRKQFDYWLRQLDCENDSTEARVERNRLQIAYSDESFAPLIATRSDQDCWKIRCFGSLRVYLALSPNLPTSR